MQIKWTDKALSDLERLYVFLAPANRLAAARAVQTLVAAPSKLALHPSIGEKLDEFEARNVRRVFIGSYEIRYEVTEAAIFILRIWHSRENR